MFRHLWVGLSVFTLMVITTRAADDDIRLTFPSSADSTTRTLAANQADLDADAVEMGYRGAYVGYRGGYVGYRGGFYVGGYARSYHGHHYGHYRGFYGGYYGPRYWGGYYTYYPRYYGYYYPSFYSYPIVSSYYYSPCAMVTVAPTTTMEYRIVPSTPVPNGPTLSTPTIPMPKAVTPPMPKSDGTYPYNGGPMTPVPMPPSGEEAMSLPRVPTPIIDRVVNLKEEATTGKFVYPAYGETPRRAGR